MAEATQAPAIHARAFRNACGRGDIDAVENYIAKDQHGEINASNASGADAGVTALMFAASSRAENAASIVAVLLRVPGIDIAKRDAAGATALMRAVQTNNAQATEAILVHARETSSTASDIGAGDALVLAAGAGNVKSLKKLVQYEGLQPEDVHSALYAACEEGSSDAVEVLVNPIYSGPVYSAARPITVPTGKQLTPLQIAAARDNDLVLIRLAYHCDIGPEPLTDAFRIACKSGSISFLKALIKDFSKKNLDAALPDDCDKSVREQWPELQRGWAEPEDDEVRPASEAVVAEAQEPGPAGPEAGTTSVNLQGNEEPQTAAARAAARLRPIPEPSQLLADLENKTVPQLWALVYELRRNLNSRDVEIQHKDRVMRQLTVENRRIRREETDLRNRNAQLERQLALARRTTGDSEAPGPVEPDGVAPAS